MSPLLRQPDYEVFPPARQLINEFVNDFTDELLAEAQNLAKRESAGVVTARHVRVAHDRIFLNRRVRTSRELAKLFGATFPGVAPGGFATALGAGEQAQVVSYVFLGMAGLALIFWGFLDG
ncbi:MAG TPA: hypothetical protein VF771_02510 [Longimicrobiaceae bacterium]